MAQPRAGRAVHPDAAGERWSAERANEWFASTGWRMGCTFIPSTAVNQLEMWQAETFDAQTIDRELGWAAGLGMNAVRVYLHDLAWQSDPAGLRERYVGIDPGARDPLQPRAL